MPGSSSIFPHALGWVLFAFHVMMSFEDLPGHVACMILCRLNARDLCAIRGTCRAFDEALVESAACEALRARAPWLAADIHENEKWRDLLRFAELAAQTRLPKLSANEDVTVVLDRLGSVHVWGPVVDSQGGETASDCDEVSDNDTSWTGDGDGGGNDDAARMARTNNENVRATRTAQTTSTRCLAAAGGYAASLGAGVAGGGIQVIRNVAGIDLTKVSGSRTGKKRPPASPVPRQSATFAEPSPGEAASSTGVRSFASASPTCSSRRRSEFGASPKTGPTNCPYKDHPEHAAFKDLLFPLRSYELSRNNNIFGGHRVVSLAVGKMHALCATAIGTVFAWGGDAAGQLGGGGSSTHTALERLAIGGSFLGSVSSNSPTSNKQHSRSFSGYDSPVTRYGSPRTSTRRRQKSRDDAGGGGSPRGFDVPGCFFLSGSGDELFGTGSCGNRTGGSSLNGKPSHNHHHHAAQERSKPRVVRTLGGKTIVQVSVARHSSGALSDRGEVFTWGSNRFGVLGLGDDIDRDEPTKIELGGGDGSDGESSDNSGSDPSGSEDRLRGPPRVKKKQEALPGGGFKFPGAMSDSDDEEEDEVNVDEDNIVSRNDDKVSLNTHSTSKGKGTETRTRKTRVVARFAFGQRHAAAVTTNGDLFCWGDNRAWQVRISQSPHSASAIAHTTLTLSFSSLKSGRHSSREPDYVTWPKAVTLPLGSSEDEDTDESSEESETSDSFFHGRTGGAGGGTDTDATFTLAKKKHHKTVKKKTKAFVVDAAAGTTHTVCVDKTGRVWSFGTGHGLAPGDPMDGYDETMYDARDGHGRRPPERARGVPRATSVAAGARHTAIFAVRARTDQRTVDRRTSVTMDVYTWGANDVGQLGPKNDLSANEASDPTPKPLPAKVASFQVGDFVG